MAASGIFAATAAGAAHEDVRPHIIGGHEATGNTDWMVSVQYDAPAHGHVNRHVCGGTLAIARDAVVINAHCLGTASATARASEEALAALATAWQMDPATLAIPSTDKQWKVRVGSKDWADGGQLVPVTSITVHEDWNWGIGAPQREVADIAVLRLAYPVDYQQVQLAGTPSRPGDDVVLYGWGIDHPDSVSMPLPRRLQQLETHTIESTRCAAAGLSSREICVGNPYGTDGPCNGDSGGPAIRYTAAGVPQLVGGVSRSAGAHCGTAPTVLTSQPEFRDWLYKVIRGGTPSVGAPTKTPVYEPPYERP